MSRSALVTGGAGFIGSHLAEGLLAAGWRVRLLDDFSSGREANLVHLRGALEVLRGDLRDRALVARALGGVEVVFHEAAVASVPRSVAEPERTHDVNVNGTLGLLECARRAGVRRVVFASSSAIYGDAPGLPKVEDMAPCPLSPYALQKYAAERYGQLFHRLHGLETVALRYFNVYGPRQDPNSEYAAVIPRFATAYLTGATPVVFGDGEQTRDFAFVSDVVEANLLAADAAPAVGAAVNVAGGRGISLNELLREMGTLTEVCIAARYEPPRPGDVRHSRADLSRARSLLGWQPRVDLRTGLARTLEHLRRSKET
jgi:nucleoside-diphosphate-sugar epimerase